MPPKRKCPANKKAEECAVCCQKVTKGEDEALFCEGKCQKWFHRYCAGVSVAHFQDLSTASAPFLCVMCYQESHGVVLEELRATVTALTDEVKELRAALQRVEARGSDVLYPVPQLRTMNPGTLLPEERSEVRRGTTLERVKLEPLRTERSSIRNPLMYSGQLISKPRSTPARESSSLVLVAFGAQ